MYAMIKTSCKLSPLLLIRHIQCFSLEVIFLS